MVEIIPAKRMALQKLFSGMDDTLILSGLQGLMGHAYADSAENPAAASLIVGDFGFVAGDADSPQALKLCSALPVDYSKSYLMMVPQNAAWQKRVFEAYGEDHVKLVTRYAFRKDTHFDVYKLLRLRSALPPEYSIIPLDERWFDWCGKSEWADGFVSQFASYDDFQKHGVGRLVMYDGEPVGGAGSYSYYHDGIEVEIQTTEPHRRKGLAAACAAELILTCLDRGLYPSWDAANMNSVHLAEKLGYGPCHEYVTCSVSLPQKA